MAKRRHRWNGSNDFNRLANNVGGNSMAVACIKCGCVKEYIGGIPTYFIDDNVYDKIAPSCDERLLKEKTK